MDGSPVEAEIGHNSSAVVDQTVFYSHVNAIALAKEDLKKAQAALSKVRKDQAPGDNGRYT